MIKQTQEQQAYDDKDVLIVQKVYWSYCQAHHVIIVMILFNSVHESTTGRRNINDNEIQQLIVSKKLTNQVPL